MLGRTWKDPESYGRAYLKIGNRDGCGSTWIFVESKRNNESINGTILCSFHATLLKK